MTKNIKKFFIAFLFIFIIFNINTVFAADTIPPVITLNGSSSLNITVADTYTELGATANDETDGDITSNIVITGTVDTSTPGAYTISYNVSDSALNTAIEVKRTINVVAPVVTLSSIAITTPANKLSYFAGESLDISGLVVTGTYSDNSTKVESINQSNISGFDSANPTLGQVLTITVNIQSATYTVDIIADPQVKLDFYTNDGVLFNQTIAIQACAESNAVDSPITVNGKCAVEQSGLTNTWTWDYAPSGWLDELGGYKTTADFSKSWGWFNGLTPGNTSLNQHYLTNNENLLLVYGTNPLKITTSSTTPTVGDTITLSVNEFSYDSSWNPTWSPALDGSVTIGTQTFPLDASGSYVYTISSIDPITIIGKKSGFVDTSSITINPIAPVLKEKLTIRVGADILYTGDIVLPEALDIDIPDNNNTTHTVSDRSVLALLYNLDQSNDTFSISDLSYNDTYKSFLLNCITPTGLDPLCYNWQYTVDDTYPPVGMDKEVLSGGENIYIYFGPQNKITLSKNSIYTSEELQVQTLKYDYKKDEWLTRTGVTVGLTQPDPDNPWTPIDDIKLLVDGTTGIAVFNSIPVGEYNVGIKEDYYWPTEKLTVLGNPVVSGGGGGSSGGSFTKTFSLVNALSFLSANQKTDGSFSNDMYTDWVAIAVGKLGSEASTIKTKVLNYIKGQTFDSSIVTNNERHAMALMALNINPYSGTSTNYIDKITNSFDGTQIGDASLYNDDIFGLIVLAKAGYTSSDDILSKVINFIISKQGNDGSWDSVDITSAAIEALNNFKDVVGVKDSINSALNYLAVTEGPDGGYGNSFSTSWAIQALSTDISFKSNLDKALVYLVNNQQNDGGLDDVSLPMDSRIWATSYAIPASQSLSWGDILNSFSKPPVFSGGGGVYFNTDSSIEKEVETEKIKETENKKILSSLDTDEDKKEKKVVEKQVFLIKKKKKVVANVTNTKIKPKINIVKSKASLNTSLTSINVKDNLLANAGASSVNYPIEGDRIVVFVSGILMVVLWGSVLNFII